ncbi:MAG: Gfo/Idh/MocA family oxidoreductase [Kiritimatiellales bacterium]|nr:Gfo/Idh/MocA family oxidoreductase [Kiritimatiellales bacterium]
MPKPFKILRRSFLGTSAAAATAGLPLWFLARELAAAEEVLPPTSKNDRPNIALIGCGGISRSIAPKAARFGDIVAVCDVDETRLAAAVQKYSQSGKTPEPFTDFRKIMERDDIHAVIQATPDHWHTLVNMAAAQAKKDVYGEKPLTLTIDEGKRMVKAIRANGVVLQTGSQQRSDKRFRLACELVRNGRIGKLQQVDVFVPAGARGGPFNSVPVPTGLDWDFWLGQAPYADYMKERCPGAFRWWYDYSGGAVVDWGAHHNDIARWAIGLDGPVSVEARALVDPIPGGFTIPSEFEATLMWANGVRQVVKTTTDDTAGGKIINPEGQRNGVKFIGTDGWIWINREELAASDENILQTPLPDNAVRLEASDNHMGNFFDCMRSRKDPICDVETGHRSATIGHLIAIGLRTGRKLQWSPEKEFFTGDTAKDGNAHVAREMRKPYDYGFLG